jgi:hypothetical protein
MSFNLHHRPRAVRTAQLVSGRSDGTKKLHGVSALQTDATLRKCETAEGCCVIQASRRDNLELHLSLGDLRRSLSESSLQAN